MARYIQDAGINQPLDVVSDAMEQYLYRNRYIRTDWKGELVYLSTDSEAKGSRYLIWSYTSGILHIEAWLKGAFDSEVGLTGAGSKKRAYKESIDSLIQKLRQPVKDEYTRAEDAYQSPTYTQSYASPKSSSAAQSYTQSNTPPVPPYIPQQKEQSSVPPYMPQSKEPPVVPPYMSQPQGPAGQGSSQPAGTSSGPVYTESWMGGKQTGTSGPVGGNFTPSQPNSANPYVPDYGEEKARKAAKGLLFGVIAIFLSFIIPIIGIILGIVGLGKCREGMESALADKARLGKRLCIIAIVFGSMRLVYYFAIACSISMMY